MNIENMFDKPDVKQLVHAFSLLDDEKDIQAFLTDICTPREICDLSQRLQVARYLDEGEPYVEVPGAYRRFVHHGEPCVQGAQRRVRWLPQDPH